MGQGTISEEIGEGEYTLDLDFGADVTAARVAKITARKAAHEALLPTLEAAESAALAAVQAAGATLTAAVAAMRAAHPDNDEERAAVEAATAASLALKLDLDKARLALATITTKIAEIDAEISYLEGFDLEETRDVWCADYTLEAEGEVATIEVPGEPVTILIAPGAPPATTADGRVLHTVAQSAAQSFYNWALLPLWQKFYPTFRFGEISEIDYTEHTCTVALDDASSSAQNLDINQEPLLEDVPIEYMDCDSRVFEDGDRVVVQFDNQDQESPKVVGFVSHPVDCFTVEIIVYLQDGPPAGVNPPAGEYSSAMYSIPRRDAEEIRDYFEAYITPDPYPTEPATAIEEIAVYVKKAGGEWVELTDFHWADSRGTFPESGQWFGLEYSYTNVLQSGDPHVEEQYFVVIARNHPGALLLDIPEFVDVRISAQRRHISDGNYDYFVNIEGVVEFLIVRTIDGEVLYHAATDMDNLGIKNAVYPDVVGYYRPPALPSPSPGFDLVWLEEYEMSDPP